ncbi:MAG: hydroxymethylbilane synthase [Armatimonadota bacterium]|nr:hydroxymethylbilane synthase [Armatimonadota bacterium]MDR7536086.1 hydroxymethylbilane synthase [Armatimonadota bacterium]
MVARRQPVRVGTRGSALALVMTAQVTAALSALGLDGEPVVIRTRGDAHPDRPTRVLGPGAFVKELEDALADGRIDLAVHSAKDLHSQTTPGLVVAAFLPRDDPRDALVARAGLPLHALPSGSRIGTDSPRRRAFLLTARPDLDVRGIRGNVDTRLRKLDAGEVDALVLAAAGLARLGLARRITETLDPRVMLPAVGQGVVAIQARAGDPLAVQVAALDDAATRRAVDAERAFVTALGGTCQTAIAALGVCREGRLTLDGAVLAPDGRAMLRDQVAGGAADAAALGETLGRRLLARGARALMVEVAP